MYLESKDKRKFARHKANITSLCIKRSEDKKNLEMDIIPIKNIGLGGVFLQADVPYKAGTEIDIQFIVPDHTKPITIKCKVAWSKTQPDVPGMGVEFISISDEDKDILIEYFNNTR